jgi:hypothetical protein
MKTFILAEAPNRLGCRLGIWKYYIVCPLWQYGAVLRDVAIWQWAVPTIANGLSFRDTICTRKALLQHRSSMWSDM